MLFWNKVTTLVIKWDGNGKFIIHIRKNHLMFHLEISVQLGLTACNCCINVYEWLWFFKDHHHSPYKRWSGRLGFSAPEIHRNNYHSSMYIASGSKNFASCLFNILFYSIHVVHVVYMKNVSIHLFFLLRLYPSLALSSFMVFKQEQKWYRDTTSVAGLYRRDDEVLKV